MKFGKLPSIENVNFTLPPDPPINTGVLAARQKEQTNKTLYIGATGWGMREWVGTVYPKGTPSQDYLYHYARQFNTIELNTTHYRIPETHTIDKWYEQSAADFKFCPKVLQQISHSRELFPPGPINRVWQFCDAVSRLKDKLGPCFIQLPPYFGVDRLPTLERFLATWKEGSEIPLSVEVRHESWFEHQKNLEKLLSLLAHYEVSTVITDVAGRRDVCHMGLTTGQVLVRFVGNGLHPTDYTRIDAWVKRLRSWFENGLSEAYFFTHEPDNVLAPELAVYLAGKFAGEAGIVTRGPRLIENDGGQMSLF